LIRTGLPITSPEGISFDYQLASLTERGLAYGLDLLIRGAVLVLVSLALLLVFGVARLPGSLFAGLGLGMIIWFAVEWGYYVVFDLLWNGQSPGKRVFDLRVIKRAGHPIGFFDSVVRNLLRAADALPTGSYAAGALAMIVTRRFQRLGDLAAQTVVVKERKAWHVGALSPPPASSFEPQSAAEAGLRRLMLSNRERRLLGEFVQRKDRLHPERREQLAQILAGAYGERYGLGWQESATALLTRLHAAIRQRERPR